MATKAIDLSLFTIYRYMYFEINNKIVIKNIPVIMLVSLSNIVANYVECDET